LHERRGRIEGAQTTWRDAGRIIAGGDTGNTHINYLIARAATSTTDVLNTRRFGTNNDAPLGVQNQSSIGPCSSDFTFSFKVPIAGWTESQNAPILVGSVTSGASSALRIEGAAVAADGTVSGETSDWLNGNCTNANPRVCTMTSGMFSSAPICVATGTDSSSTPDIYPTIQLTTTSGFNIQTNNHLPGFANVSNQRPVNIICMGLK
jgi:hypothetical protein